MVARVVIWSGFMRSSITAESRCEIGGIADHFAVAAECIRELREIGIGETGAGNASGIRAFLVHADRAVHLVVEHQNDWRDAVVERCGDLLTCHQEAAVANHADDHAIGERDLRADGGWNAVAHRAIGWTDIALLVSEVDESRGPAGKIAGVRGDDGVGIQQLFQLAHCGAEIERAFIVWHCSLRLT
jgi:hypothetical protein